MRLSDFEGEEALDVLCDIMDPAAEIMADPEIRAAYQSKKARRIDLVKMGIRNHKKAIISILAALDRKPVEEYKVNILTLPMKLLEILNDPDLKQLFTWQGQTGDAKSSASASESTEEN